jgi:Flp pilus assembly protein TadD
MSRDLQPETGSEPSGPTSPTTAEARLVRLLAEIGIAAAGHGFPREAETILAGVQAVRPDSEAPHVGRAIGLLCAGRHDDAVRLLWREGLQAAPDSAYLRAFLAMALKLAGRAGDAERIAAEVLAGEADETAKALAREVVQPG